MANNNKETKPIKGLTREVRESHQEEIQNILWRTEEPIHKELSDPWLDRRNEIIKTIGGDETTINRLLEEQKRLRKYLRKTVSEHKKTFPDELYGHWRRLRGWDKNPYPKHHKPKVFSWYTRRDVYGRFPKEILPELERRNGYVCAGGIRLHRHFQLLTKKAYKSLKDFIEDIIKVAEKSQSMYEYNLRYAAEFGRPFQMSLFENNDITS